MRHIKLSLCLAVALSALAYSASAVRAEPCTIGLGVHNHAWILLKGKKLAQCQGAMGCKCVSCWNADGSASSTCFPLFVSMPK
jgi:hypothetical protein